MIYPDTFEEKIGFSEIRNLLHGFCLSPLGHVRVDGLAFSDRLDEIKTQYARLAEFTQILDESQDLPPLIFFDIRSTILRLKVVGSYLEEAEIWKLFQCLQTLHGWIELVRKTTDEQLAYPALSKMSEGVFTFYSVTKEISRLLDKFGNLRDDASPELLRIRTEIRKSEGRVSRVLNGILRAAQEEGLVASDVSPTLRDGRLVIPVAPAMKRRLRGIVHDESATGKTFYVEPAEVVEANNYIRELESAQKREIIRILHDFSEKIRVNIPELIRGMDFLADLELVYVKHKLARHIKGVIPHISSSSFIDWTLARHPLLEHSLLKQGKKIVPLEISLDSKHRLLLISGPNAGGKSVTLKTVGLIQYMAQCGLPVPLGENSRMGLFKSLFIDIGDQQSIEDDLSTYSSHLLNMKNMMKYSDDTSLLLIDEFGGGTEPTIGGAIAQAVLKRFVRNGAFGVITTHYQNLKHFAEDTDYLINGAMLYDRHRMKPLFQLQIGNPGSSFAIEIARQTGIPEDVIADATEIVGKDYVNADKYLLDITRDRLYWKRKRENVHQKDKKLSQTLEDYQDEMAQLKEQKKKVMEEARREAQKILSEANARIENTIREIKEAQAEKERTREARTELDKFKDEIDQTDFEKDEFIEKKIRQILARRERKQQRKSQKDEAKTSKEKKTMQKDQPKAFQVGDPVKIAGQITVGTITSVKKNEAYVTFGQVKTLVKLTRLVHVEDEDIPRKQQTVTVISRQTTDSMSQTYLNFHPEIDVRGMRADEALQAITYFMDDAILVQAQRVRILHGTGTGALRQLIRDYLATLSGVSSFHDEHVQLGGAGITVVELE